ncbi:CLH2 [Linum grandiflorum]
MTTSTSTDVFHSGRYKTHLQSVEPSSAPCCKTKPNKPTSYPPPPKPLLIASPAQAGEFPILLFLHGYLLCNTFYSQLILHVASHGFIVIAPQVQLYTVAGPDCTEEINSVAAITNWVSQGLQLLPLHIKPDLTKLCLAGHSRGGKTAFALALNKAATTLRFSALIGVDPVDGMDMGKQTNPPVLTYVPRSFDLEMAVMVIGSGLGEVRRNPIFPPCAPKGVNHEEFFRECKEPACYFVVKDYGHVDMLDDDTTGVRGKVSYCLCKNGGSREPMRRFVAGATVAFMRAYLQGNGQDLAVIRGGDSGPVQLSTAEFLL